MSLIQPEITFRSKKGKELTPLELDKNFSNIKQSIAELCSLLDAAGLSSGTGLSVLDNRVTINETSIIDLTNELIAAVGDIATNMAAITQNSLDIDANVLAIQQANIKINENAAAIAGVVSAVGQNSADIASLQTATADIATNTASIVGLTAELASLTISVDANSDAINNINASLTSINLDIAALNTSIAANTTAINNQATRLNNLGRVEMVVPQLLASLVGMGSTSATIALPIPVTAVAAILQARSEIAHDDEAHTTVNNVQLARVLTGTDLQDLDVNSESYIVDTRASPDISVQQVVVNGNTQAKIAAAKTELFLIGYHNSV